jgi:FkbM family methyltransferase
MEQEKKNKNKFIKSLTYNPVPRRIARFFGLSKIFRKIYFYTARPKNGIISCDVSGINAKFYVKTPGELRLIESMGGGGRGEKNNLETLILSANNGDVVYDIGGNIGLYSIFLSKKVSGGGKVIVFEPEKENYDHLLDNIELNNIKNIVVFKKALGEKNEQAKLYIGEEMGNCSLLEKTGYENKYELIDVVNGDNFIEKNNLPYPNLIKIDVEGYEYNVLKGLSKSLADSKCRVLCCEIHKSLLPKNIKSEDIMSLIKSFGFTKNDIYPREEEDHIICYK